MGCVNKSSKEFKALAARNKLAPNTLELIIHQYWIEKGSEDLFPTDVYIQSLLGNSQYRESGSSVRKLWKKYFSTPFELATLEQATALKNKAFRFFPKSEVIYYRNEKDGFTLSVNKPVERVSFSRSQFIKDESHGAKSLNLGLKENQTYSVDKVQELFNRFNTDRTTKHLADKVFGLVKNLGLQVKFSDELPFDTLGRYRSGEITFNKSFLERTSYADLKAPVLLHELIHSLTMYALSENTEKWQRPEQLQQFRNEINQIYSEVKGRKELKGELGVSSVQEFVAELANPVFRSKLQSLDKKSFWTKILDAIKSLFGIETSSDYYTRSMTALDNALNAFDINTYMLYNNARTLLKQGFDEREWRYRTLSDTDLKEAVANFYRDRLPFSYEISSDTAARLQAAKEEAELSRKSFIYAQDNDDTGEAQTRANQERIDSFKDKYGDLVKSITPIRNGRGGLSFKVTFKNSSDLLRMENKESLAQLNYIENMSHDDLVSELALIEQEWADYNMVAGKNGINIPKKERDIEDNNGKHYTFTFKDGTTVDAPFNLNNQQIDALNQMADFIESGDTSMTLSGYAGTGKTSLMQMLAEKMRKEFRPIVFSATTNKAAAVLKSKVEEAGFDAQTLNKVFGIQVEVDPTKAYNQRTLVNKLKEDIEIGYGTTVIIDEASMINEENYKILNDIARHYDLKIIYVGDKAQLAPVNENQISKVFRNGDGKVIELTQVERTGDNAILKEATDLRNGKELSGESAFNAKGEGVAYLTRKSSEAISNVIKHYIQGLRQNPDYFRILAYTNKAVSKYNDYVRRLLGYKDYIPRLGEPIVGYSNWGYNRKSGTYRFINSESYRVVDVMQPRKVQISLDDGNSYTMEAIPITLENSLGERDTFKYMDVKGNLQNREAAVKLANIKKKLWEQARRVTGRNKAAILQQISSIDQFLFVNDNIEDEQHHLLQSKTANFGYALTVHKSQGSTFTHVLMDDVDISSAKSSDFDMENAVPVGLDRVSEAGIDFDNSEVVDTDEVDLGELPMDNSTETAPNQVTNIRQQLEYVGVSRATNTVTIISDNVKKEDSPLNHITGEKSKVEHNKTQDDNVINNNSMFTTVAPYYNTPVTKEDFKEIKEKVEKDFKEKANDIAESLGIKIKAISTNIGAFTFQEGETAGQQVRELSYTFELDTNDENKADLFASLMGDLGYEQQGAVISANYTDKANANAVELKVRVKSFKGVKDALDNAGITDYTINLQDHTISILGFDVNDITELESQLNKLKEQLKDNYNESEINYSRSRYLDKTGRRNVYETWNKRGKQDNGKLHSYTRQAYNKLTGREEGINPSSTSSVQWGRDVKQGQEGYEVSSQGDKRFSALNATFKQGTIIDGVDVGGKTIEDVYQHVIKRSRKGQGPAVNSRVGVFYRGYALPENRKAKDLDETVSNTAIDYIEGFDARYHFQSAKDTALGYGKAKTEQEGKKGWYPQVGAYYLDAKAKVAYFKNVKEYSRNKEKAKDADVIILEQSTSFTDESEMIVRKGKGNLIHEIENPDTFNPEEISYEQGYLPLWQEWARQNPQLMEELRQKAQGKILTDQFASTRVSQARALADILNATQHNNSIKAKEIADKTATYGVEIVPNIKASYKQWLVNNPNGIIAYRINYRTFNTPENVAQNIIGNPFDWQKYGEEDSLQKFYDWLTTGNNFGESLANEPYRQAIIQRLLNADPATKIAYYKEKNQPSHATVLGYLIQNKQLLQLDPEESRSFQTETLKQQDPSSFTSASYQAVAASQQTNSGSGTLDLGEGFYSDAFNIISQSLQNAILTGDWTDNDITELNNLIDKIENGTIIYQRFPQEASRGFHQGGRINEAASVILRGKGGSNQEKPLSVSERYERDKRQQPVQERIIESWAKKQGVWFDNLDDAVKGKVQKAQGGEATVFMDDGDTVTKFITTEYFITPQFALDRITLHNTLFPDAPLTLRGFGRNKEGEFIFVVDQPFIEGTTPTMQEIQEFIEKAGFKKSDKDKGNTYTNDSIYLSDLHDENVIKTPQGNLVVIDVDARLNTPELNRDGKYQIDNSLIQSDGKDLSIDEFEPHALSLPNYEGFRSLHEEITIDAEWKIPLLQKLDNQMTDKLTDEEKSDIAADMDNILEATSKEDIANPVTEQQKETRKELDEFDKINQQMDNLLDSNLLTASEIRHVAELVVNAISDNITRIQNEKGLAQEQFPFVKTTRDFQKATRRQVVDTIGIGNFIYRAKQIFDPSVTEYDDVDVMEQAWFITDNWDAIMALAADIFVMNEGFGISRNYGKGTWETSNATNVDYDNFNQSQDEDTIKEIEGDEQEHWQVESRTIDVLNSMSALVRMAIHDCYLLDKDGNKVMSKWMIPERVNPRKVTNSLLRWLQGSQNLDDMVSKLSAKQKDNPWLSQLVSRLSDRSGKETDFQSQFFGVFSKPFQLYSIVLLEDGKYASILVNSHPALTEAMNSITSQFRIGEHPLLTSRGINKKLLGTTDTVKPQDDFNLHKALSHINAIRDALNHRQPLDGTLVDEATENIMGAARILGYPVTEDMVSRVMNAENIKKIGTALHFIVKSLDAAAAKQAKGNISYDPFKFGGDNNIGHSLRNFLSPLTESLEDTAVSAFYDSGKMYQSYVIPSFLTKLFDKFHLEGQEFENFIMDQYGDSEWFKFPNGGIDKGWRNEWLRLLARDENARKVFDHKVELNFNKHNYMRNMTDAEYTLSLITEYFSETGQDKDYLVPAWFRVPIQSNKPSSDFIKFYSYRGSICKQSIVDGLHSMFLQELSRIQTVRMRNKSKNGPEFIENFDTNGKRFNFLPYLNSYLENSETAKDGRTLIKDAEGKVSSDNETFAALLQKKVEGLEALTAEEEAQLSSLVDKIIFAATDDRVQSILNNWENSGIMEAAKSIKGIGTEDEIIRSNLENFLWNDTFAAKNILQLTIGDIAFYKDAENLQKRLAQLHAPGIRGNINATDYNGNRVSDGKYRTAILNDFDTYISNVIDNLTEVFDRKIAAAPVAARPGLMALKESLVGENGAYRQVNVTDAQGYSSPSSYRKKAFIFGKWSRQAEDIYQKLLKGDYTYTDLETAFQPLKPFVYAQMHKNLGVANAPIKTMPVPFQAKNSEYLLIMADAILQGESLSRPNLLRAVYRVMEDSEKLNPTKGIDTIQFESAIKSGLQGRLNIAQFRNTVGGEEAAYNYMMDRLYKPNTDGSRSTEYNTDVYVHEASYDDYCLQQEVPEHFKNHKQAHGSQVRMITPSDLDFYKNPNGDLTAEDNQVYYEFDEPDGTHKKLRADEFRREYEETIAANISASLENLSKELHLDSEDRKERNIALSKILQREILGSPRYGVDLLQACSVDKKTGEFRIPKGDPIQSKRIEQLINSIIKNRVNKQTIAGGPIVQVTNFGTSRQLHIRFHDRNGGILPTREEYEAKNGTEEQNQRQHQKTEGSATDKFNARFGKAVKKKTYEEYCKENQAGIAYFEVFIPMWANEVFDNFMNSDGTIDIKAIEALDPDLLKMIGYRIPTEDKYSTIPMKVVGFMPKEAGDVIMQPYEMTTIDDSDHDIDKKYVMRKDIMVQRKKQGDIIKAIWDEIKDETPEETGLTDAEREKIFKDYKEKMRGYHLSDEELKEGLNKVLRQAYYDKPKPTREEVVKFVQDPFKYRDNSAWHKRIWEIYKRVAYETVHPTEGKLYRDNKIVDMTWAVLTNEMTADKVLNPGGFDAPKKMGYTVAAYRNPANSYSWQQLEGMGISELKDACYTDKDLTWLDTQIQFYKQNAAAASLIGVFAVNKVAHATLESNGIMLAVNEICGDTPFTIAGTTFGNMMELDPKYDSEGNLIGKTLGSLVGASADAVKDPILNLMNINMTTVGVLSSMLRLGMPFNDAALFLSQDVIGRLLTEFNKRNLTNYEPLSHIIDEYLAAYQSKYGVNDSAAINTEPLTKEELIEGLTPNEHKATDYKVLLAFKKVKALSDAVRNPTFATRFNSISSAVGPLIVDNLILEHKMQQFSAGHSKEGTHFYDSEGNPMDINSIFDRHPVLKQFSRTVGIARDMFMDMPAGSEGFRNLLEMLPDGISAKMYQDKTLLDKLSNFYQSYLLIASGMVNPESLKNYVDGFPQWFMKQNYKEKYPGNALIDAIRLNINKKTGRPYLQINITGMDAQQKEILGNAWVDLHKSDPELSKRLFTYSFFRAGIGFSPKTFMSLVPTYVKERLSTDLSDGTKATYVDTYRNFPGVSPSLVIDQFVRNNWDNNKLVPRKGGKGTHYMVDTNAGRLMVQHPNDIADLSGVDYMKTKVNGQTYMWKLISASPDGLVFTRVKPLGNNGEYLEMSMSDIANLLNDTVADIEEADTTDLQAVSPQESDAACVTDTNVTSATEQAKKTDALIDGIMKQNPKLSKDAATQMLEKIKKSPNIYKGFLKNVFDKMGMKVEINNVLEEFNKMC